MIVVDASVLAPALADDGEDGDKARRRLLGEQLAAPEMIDVEVLSVLRRQRAKGLIDDRRVNLALTDLAQVPISRARHGALLGRAWDLRDAVTPYDAVYVALAELLGAVLLTADHRLTRAPGPRCTFEVLS